MPEDLPYSNKSNSYNFRFCEKIRDLVDKDFLSISQKFVVRQIQC